MRGIGLAWLKRPFPTWINGIEIMAGRQKSHRGKSDYFLK